MGISTISSYCGAQIFEAVGLGQELVDRYFTGTPRGSAASASRRSPRTRSPGTRARIRARAERAAAGRRRLRVAPRRRAPPVEPGDDRAAPARGARTAAADDVRGVLAAVNDESARKRDAARAAAVPRAREAGSRSTRSSPRPRSSSASRPARCRSARSSREAHETLAIAMNRIGGKLEHRRGRRGPGALTRDRTATAPLGDQAGRVGPLRRQHQLPRQRRRAADQDGAGREAGRGRPAARATRSTAYIALDPLHDAGRRADLAAAAPRHLLDRGPQAADLRPPLRQPGGADLGQARRRGRRRHGRGRRREGERRPRPDLRPRRRHRRVAALARSSSRASRGRSGSPRRSRRSCSTTCARGSGCRPTAS